MDGGRGGGRGRARVEVGVGVDCQRLAATFASLPLAAVCR
jgi:hypothetical protein